MSRHQRYFLSLATFMLTVGLLYWAQTVFIPVATALLLTFILSPLVMLLQRYRFPRWLASLTVVLLMFVFLIGIIGLFYSQVRDLGNELPKVKEHVLERINTLTQSGRSQWIDNFVEFFDEIAKKIGAADRTTEPVLVRIAESSLGDLPAIAGTTLTLLVHVFLVFILVIFMLIRREDLRNRLIRLWGDKDLTSSTKALDDAAQRLSRFLLTQFVFNFIYGALMAIGLFFIGVPYSLVWGLLTAIMRYVPYIGPWVAAFFPVLLSLTVGSGLTTFFLVIGFIVVLELIHSNFIEPWAFGRSIGVSEVALLMAAVFWTWLWGPVGLVLSTPLTACLVVLGRHVPALEIFPLLLGDEPVLERHAAFYQRLLAKDPVEAADLVQEFLKERPVDEIFDGVLLPALVMAKTDQERGDLSSEEVRTIANATREIFKDEILPAHWESLASQPKESLDRPRALIIGIPCRDDVDDLILDMMKEYLEPRKFRLQVETPRDLYREGLGRLKEERPLLVFLAAYSPRSISRARIWCRKVRQFFTDVPIAVGYSGQGPEWEQDRDNLKNAGASEVFSSFLDSYRYFEASFSAQTPAQRAESEEIDSLLKTGANAEG